MSKLVCVTGLQYINLSLVFPRKSIRAYSIVHDCIWVDKRRFKREKRKAKGK